MNGSSILQLTVFNLQRYRGANHINRHRGVRNGQIGWRRLRV